MKPINFLIVATIAGILTYFRAFSVFFAQDDFVLISHFSGHGLFGNLINVFGQPTISHWRPFFNLFFTISGTFFGKNYQLYHLFLLIILVFQSLLVFTIGKKLLKNGSTAFMSALIFLLHPAFFTSVYWISGGAVMIGFLFFLMGFLFLVKNRNFYAFLFLFLSFLGSESMAFGSLVFAAYLGLFSKSSKKYLLIFTSLAIAFAFAVTRVLFLTTRQTFEAYQFEISLQTFAALKFYLLRILGIKEGAALANASFTILFVVLISTFGILSRFATQRKLLYFLLFVLVLGLFPFVLIPNHMSAHYMAISIWAFSTIIALGLNNLKKYQFVMLATLFVVYIFNNLTVYENQWIISRSNLAKTYILDLQNKNLENGTNIVFGDNYLSTSQEAYIALGTGKAIDWWFKGRDYKTCFVQFELCNTTDLYVPFK